MSGKNEVSISELTNVAISSLAETVPKIPELLGKIGELMNEKAQMIAENKAEQYKAQKEVLIRALETELQSEVERLKTTEHERHLWAEHQMEVEKAFVNKILQATDKEEREEFVRYWEKASEQYLSKLKTYIPERSVLDKMGDFFKKLRLKG